MCQLSSLSVLRLIAVNLLLHVIPESLIPPTQQQDILCRHRTASGMPRKAFEVDSDGFHLCPDHLGEGADELRRCIDLEIESGAVDKSPDGEPEGGFKALGRS